MTTPTILLSIAGITAGSFIAIQTLLNAGLGQYLGTLGAVLVLTIISVVFLALLALISPSSVSFVRWPPVSEAYLYLGGFLGVAILAIPICLVPFLGTTSTVILMVLGQLIAALVIDHFGLLASPKIEVTVVRMIGVALVVVGACLAAK